MKESTFRAYLAIEAAANLAILFMTGFKIAESYYESKVRVKQSMVLDACLNAVNGNKEEKSDSEVE